MTARYWLARLGVGLKAALRWLRGRPRLALAILALGLIAFLLWRVGTLRGEVAEQKDRVEAAELARDEAVDRAWHWHDAHSELVEKTRLAREAAARADAANVARVEREFAAQLERIENDNAHLRERNRALVAFRLRDAPGRAPAATRGDGGGGASDLSGIPDLSGGALPDAALAIVPRTDLGRCADAYAQLAGLITAWRAAETIDVNANAGESVSDAQAR